MKKRIKRILKKKMRKKTNRITDKTLEQIYKRNRICINCESPYGSDLEKDNGLCPVCSCKRDGKSSRLLKTFLERESKVPGGSKEKDDG